MTILFPGNSIKNLYMSLPRGMGKGGWEAGRVQKYMNVQYKFIKRIKKH